MVEPRWKTKVMRSSIRMHSEKADNAAYSPNECSAKVLPLGIRLLTFSAANLAFVINVSAG